MHFMLLNGRCDDMCGQAVAQGKAKENTLQKHSSCDWNTSQTKAGKRLRMEWGVKSERDNDGRGTHPTQISLPTRH
jgi:hypothetical protein